MEDLAFASGDWGVPCVIWAINLKYKCRSRVMSRRIFLGVIIKSAAIVAVSLGIGVTPLCWGQAPGNGAKGLARAIEVQERHTNSIMAKPGVVGTAVGLDARARHVVKVYVATAEDAVGIANQLEGVPVTVEVTGLIFALKGKPSGVNPATRFARPVPIGVSTGHPDITAGTIGCRVVDDSGKVYALSNNHVYANENKADVDDAVIQPGTYDGGESKADDIGWLSDFGQIDFTGKANFFDAAIAISNTALLGNSTPSGGYGTPKSMPADPAIRMKVMKYGRTTSQTVGQIDAINAAVDVIYDSGIAHFVNQIVITGSFSAGGDSGSLVVVSDAKGKSVGPDHRKPVGLLFAGSSAYTIASPIDVVLASFGVTVDGEGEP
jgi:hypothetical protein